MRCPSGHQDRNAPGITRTPFSCGLMDVGLRAVRWTAARVGECDSSANLSSTPSVHQFNRNRGIEEKEGESWLLGSDGLRWTYPPSPGRITPRPPHRPLSDVRAPDNLNPHSRRSAGGSDRPTVARECRACGAASRDLPGPWGQSPVTGETGQSYKTTSPSSRYRTTNRTPNRYGRGSEKKIGICTDTTPSSRMCGGGGPGAFC